MVIALVGGCAPSATLSVAVVTDYLAGVEFVGVRVDLETGIDGGDTVDLARRERIISRESDWLGGVQVASYADLTIERRYQLRVALVGIDGAEVATTRVQATLTAAATAATVVLSRRCRQADCSATERCLGDQCVPLDCIQLGGDCGSSECDSDVECSALFSAECSAATCSRGLCLANPGPDSCDTGRVCYPERGCVDPLEPVDLPRWTSAAEISGIAADGCIKSPVVRDFGDGPILLIARTSDCIDRDATFEAYRLNRQTNEASLLAQVTDSSAPLLVPNFTVLEVLVDGAASSLPGASGPTLLVSQGFRTDVVRFYSLNPTDWSALDPSGNGSNEFTVDHDVGPAISTDLRAFANAQRVVYMRSPALAEASLQAGRYVQLNRLDFSLCAPGVVDCSQPTTSVDGLTLVLRHGRWLYGTTRASLDATFFELVALPSGLNAINTEEADSSAPFIDGDGELFFVSDRSGSARVYRAELR